MIPRFVAVLLVTLVTTNAVADPITISGASDPVNDGVWDVTLISGADLQAALPTLRSQIWWEDETLALLFINTVQDLLGFPNSFGTRGPAFLITETGSLNPDPTFGPYQGYRWNANLSAPTRFLFDSGSAANQMYAVASRVTVPEPGTLGLLSLGLVGMSLVRRKRSA